MAKLSERPENEALDVQLRKKLKQTTKLPPEKLAILEHVIRHALEGFKELTSAKAIRETKKGLKRLDKVLNRLEAMLKCKDIVDALNCYNSNGTFGFLLSSSAAMHIEGYQDGEVHLSEVRNIVSRKKLGSKVLTLSDLDDLAVAKRQRQLNDKNHESITLMVEQTRYSINSWLSLAGKDEGGRRIQSQREMILFWLAGHAEEILGTLPTASSTGPFVKLCTNVLGSLNMSTDGLEDAVKRTLKKLREFLKARPMEENPWVKFTPHQSTKSSPES